MNFDKLNKYGLCVFPYWRKVESGVMFERTRIANSEIINIRFEHGTFFKLPLFEEVPRNF